MMVSSSPQILASAQSTILNAENFEQIVNAVQVGRSVSRDE